ncbi:hypothetical protein MUA03_17170 [Enterobacteriaceae bacterium H16N7]|nr:hypothetical protein [Dryocola clanedunensis]
MKHSILCLAILVAGTSSVDAASCRAATAAQAGSDAGYARDKAADDAWSQRENQVSDGLQQCLGSISTAITMPTFPSLNDVLSGIEEKVCSAARDQIGKYVPDSIDPWGDIPGQNGSSTIPVTVHAYAPSLQKAPAVAATQAPPPAAATQPATTGKSAFYSW